MIRDNGDEGFQLDWSWVAPHPYESNKVNDFYTNITIHPPPSQGGEGVLLYWVALGNPYANNLGRICE